MTTVTFPTTKLEAWKFTSLKALEQAVLAPVTGDFHSPDLSRYKRLTTPSAITISAYNGFFQPWENELPTGVTVLPLNTAAKRWPQQLPNASNSAAEALQNLAQSDLERGIYIEVAPHTQLSQQLELFFAHDEHGSTHIPVVINVGHDAKLTVLSNSTGRSEQAYWHNRVQHWHVGTNAQVTHLSVQQQANNSFHTAANQVQLEHNAQFHAIALNTGGQLARQEWLVTHAPQSHFGFRGLQLTGSDQHHDFHLPITHAQPQATSDIQVRNLVAAQGHGVFQGKYHIVPNAQQTDAQMLCKTLLLSEKAKISAKPELEIHADDVTCSHGATCGQLDAEALFYLQSRGLSQTQAQQMLMQAFAHDILTQLPPLPAEVSAQLHQLVDAKLTELST